MSWPTGVTVTTVLKTSPWALELAALLAQLQAQSEKKAAS